MSMTNLRRKVSRQVVGAPDFNAPGAWVGASESLRSGSWLVKVEGGFSRRTV